MKEIFQKVFSFKYLFTFLFVIFFIVIIGYFDINKINSIFTQNQYLEWSIWGILLLFFLRSISIIIPMLPGTYCSVIAGYLYGFEVGLVLIFFSDLFACTSSFLIARRLGKDFVKLFLGSKQMRKVEEIGHRYLEKNFFLMVACLMTQFFDFVCYSIGLTKISLRRFLPALSISIIISDAPFVAGGFAIRDLKNISISQILNGEVDFIGGHYLLIFISSIVIVFLLAILNIFIKRNSRMI